jgi:hypothetical protein
LNPSGELRDSVALRLAEEGGGQALIQICERSSSA